MIRRFSRSLKVGAINLDLKLLERGTCELETFELKGKIEVWINLVDKQAGTKLVEPTWRFE